MGEVRGVILDASAIFFPRDNNATPSIRPGADFLFQSLQFSELRTGISYGPDFSFEEISSLRRTLSQYSFDCTIFCASSPDDFINNIRAAWSDVVGSILYLICGGKEEIFLKLCSYGWLLTVVDIDGGSRPSQTTPNISYIRKLEELPLNICHLNKKAVGGGAVVVGYIMKPSRHADFAKRGAFPMRCTENGLIFFPLSYELPITVQLQDTDLVLHKATDYISSIELSLSSTVGPRITYSSGMEQLKRFLEHQQKCCVIDPFKNLIPILDRLQIQQLLLGLEELNEECHPKIRGPTFLKVDEFDEPNWTEKLSKAMLLLPNIVKPQVACGVAGAHSMAIVFRTEDYAGLTLPLPAVVQEYVDHSSTIYKVYVLGKSVFYAVKKSTPNASMLRKLCQANELRPLLFDSLKSLPAAGESHPGDKTGTAKKGAFNFEQVTKAANWLQGKLGLTIFGFDVVIQEGTGDHVIVDVNYLPSFKEVPDDVAIPAFWEAVKGKYEEMKA